MSQSPVVDSASFEGFDPEEDAEYGDFEDLEANDVASEQDQADDRQDEEENAAIAASNSGNRPPTRDELRSIKEASELYKSNTFKLAVRYSNLIHSPWPYKVHRLMKCCRTYAPKLPESKPSRTSCINFILRS